MDTRLHRCQLEGSDPSAPLQGFGAGGQSEKLMERVLTALAPHPPHTVDASVQLSVDLDIVTEPEGLAGGLDDAQIVHADDSLISRARERGGLPTSEVS